MTYNDVHIYSARRMGRSVQNAICSITWALKHAPISDVERYGLRLAEVHVRDERFDLAVEDFEWLARKTDGQEKRGPIPIIFQQISEAAEALTRTLKPIIELLPEESQGS